MKNRFICAEEVAQELSVSKPYAYKLIRQLNDELKAKRLYYHFRTGKTASISMKGSTEQERRMNNAGIQKREQWNMVCDGEICQLERRA